VPSTEERRIAQEPIVTAPPSELAPAPSQPQVELADIYFDYDQYIIRGDAQSVLETNAVWFKAGPDRTVLIEGHCDERGTSAYNLVLGERRAAAAKRYLQDLGVAPSRIKIASYGKERPFCTEHSEACWQSNRRAHFRLQ
jgi:peptidoglycan-associated lipoprotein